MRLRIRHRTVHRYDSAPGRLAQLIPLTPSASSGLRVLTWQVSDERGALPFSFADAHGNLCHYLARRSAPQEVCIVAEGEVETLRIGEPNAQPGALPPRFFLRATPLTAPHASLDALAREAHSGAPARAEDELLALAVLVRERIPHRIVETTVRTNAADALAGAGGVCQDRAHVLIAAARALGHPARYVSGYLHDADADAGNSEGAMHAWAEVWLEQRGWLALDPSSGERTGGGHVSVAVGLDYTDAAPVRGVRTGGAQEQLSVSVRVQETQQRESQQQ